MSLLRLSLNLEHGSKTREPKFWGDRSKRSPIREERLRFFHRNHTAKLAEVHQYRFGTHAQIAIHNHSDCPPTDGNPYSDAFSSPRWQKMSVGDYGSVFLNFSFLTGNTLETQDRWSIHSQIRTESLRPVPIPGNSNDWQTSQAGSP